MQPRQLTGIARFEELPHEIGRPGKEHATFVLGRFHTQRDRHARATCHRYMPSAGSRVVAHDSARRPKGTLSK